MCKDRNLIDYNGGLPYYIPREYLYKGRQGIPIDIWAFRVIILFISGLIPILKGNWLIINIFLDFKVYLEMVNWLYKVDKVIDKILEYLFLIY